jgi:hypothetical protein
VSSSGKLSGLSSAAWPSHVVGRSIAASGILGLIGHLRTAASTPLDEATESRSQTSCNQHGHLGHDALPACAAPLLRLAGSTGAGCQTLTGHAATRCSWRVWGVGTSGRARAHLVHAAALRSASASRGSTIWEHGLFVRLSREAPQVSLPYS